MKPWKAHAIAWSLFALLIGAVLTFEYAKAGDEYAQDYVLFNGVTYADTLAHASPWFPVKDANRVIFRTWTTHSNTAADTLFTDSITVWQTLFSDSVSFLARDSAGVIVTANSLIPTTTAHGPIYPICADSVAFTDGYQDSSGKSFSALTGAPDNVPLRAPVTGSGRLTTLFVTSPNSIAAYGDGSFGKAYCRIRYTPNRRDVTPLLTTPNRVTGLKGVKIIAHVIYRNK